HAVGQVADLAGGLGQRLALLGGQHRRQVGGVLLDERRRLREDRRALLDVAPGPRREGALRRRDGELYVLARGGGDGVDDVLGGGVDDLDLPARGGLPPLAPDQHFRHLTPPLDRTVERL